jgi:hypothetical protein
MSYQPAAVTLTLPAPGTSRVRVLLRLSARPLHQACVPSGGVVYSWSVLLSLRLTTTACVVPPAAVFRPAALRVNSPLWPGFTVAWSSQPS